MDFLERAWEWIGFFFSGLISGFERLITGIFGSSNARYIKKLQPKIDAIGDLEPELEKLSDEELSEKTADFRRRLRAGETLDDILVEAFAVCREGGKRYLGMRHYDVQLIGGMVLHSGAIAEMVTGEGKTLVATLPAYLNAIAGSVHVVTVNDYLARRDMEWMGPLFMGLGLTVAAIQSGMEPEEKQKAYAADITYGTNNEFGFDYLRDNMKHAAAGDKRYASYPRMQQVQGHLTYAIIDEVDNILIDEARTPLIISGPAHENITKYKDADRVARALKAEEHFVVNEKDHTCSLTDAGVRDAEKLAGVESFYTAGNTEWPHLMDNALKAHHLYKKDVNYVVKEGRIIIVDEFTGRLMDGRQWSDGLHQAVEAKENVTIKEETQTLATVTLQNFFKLYDKLCGMTGTAMTEANEFWKIYGLDVIAIPTNRTMLRKEFPDAIYRTEGAKYRAVADDVERVNRWDVLYLKSGDEVWGEIKSETDDEVTIQIKESKNKETVSKSKIKEIAYKGRPVLVGTVSIEKSERLSALLTKRGVKHEVLNAKHHKREAEIVAQAGREGAVTIATNMAGRGTDIILGGNPENLAWSRLQDKYPTRLEVPREEWDSVVEEIENEFKMKEAGKHILELGGLYVIGTERHDARRIDLQLRGRCGRQGDPGSSRFFLSLDDDLMRIFYGDWVKGMLDYIGMTDEDRIENAMITRRIEGAQKKREEHNFEIRKNLLEYDEVMDEQRKRIYAFRQQILDGDNCREIITDMIHEEVNEHVDSFLDRDYGVESFAEFASRKLSTPFESPQQFRGMTISDAEQFAKTEAERMAESDIIGAIDENLPDGEEDDESEWNWGALARFANTRWQLSLRDGDLKKIGRDQVAGYLMEKANEAIYAIDLSDGANRLEEDYGLREAVRWVNAKFDFDLEFEEIANLEPAEFKQRIIEKAEEAYDKKEAEIAVSYVIQRSSIQQGAQTKLDRDELIRRANFRFDAELTEDDLKNKQRDEVFDLLFELSQKQRAVGEEVAATVPERVAACFENDEHGRANETRLDELIEWMKEELYIEFTLEELSDLSQEELEHKVDWAVQQRYFGEMRNTESEELRRIVDSSWKDHLLSMDYLRSAVQYRGVAQLDPKVEYKREGMRIFENVWKSIGEQMTDLIFRLQRQDETIAKSVWSETSATHEDAQAASNAQLRNSLGDTTGGGNEGQKLQPIRNKGETPKRNDPCPCGSGKKYKNCHMRKGGAGRIAS